MINKESWFHRKLRSLLIYIYTRIENEGNIDFLSNGEGKFLLALKSYFEKHVDSKLELQFFDIGANTGEFTRLLRSHISETANIHVFEPVESLCDFMEKQFNNDQFIHINAVGVSSKQGSQIFYSDKEGSALGSFLQRDEFSTGLLFNQNTFVSTIRLDSYIDSKKIEHINFIKIDTEGHEYEVIESLGRYLDPLFIDFLQFEYGGTTLDAGRSLRKYFECFEKAGFVVAKIMQNGLLVRPYESWMDDFRYANFVAISPVCIGKYS
jgi:FkbM family methyltransferase